ncbi:MAG: hypothetical protein AB7E80_10570 [Hyphomicrobiaceae bacterium]
MSLRVLCLAVAAALVVMLSPMGSGPAAATATATSVLFDAKHLASLGKGDRLAYRFQRTVSNPQLLGEPYSDDITVDILAADADQTKQVAVQVFTGERARREQRIAGMTGNPLLVVFLDRAVLNMTQLAGGNRPYLKQKIKIALDHTAQIDKVSVTYKGKAVEGYRVRVSPFLGDAAALKMMGYDGARLEFVVSENIPGQFASMTSVFESPMQGSPKLEERITLDGVEAVK